MTRYKIAKPSKGGRQNKAAKAQVEVAIHSQLAVLNYPVIFELRKDDGLNAERSLARSSLGK